MSTSITALNLEKVISATGTKVNQSIGSSGNSGYTTRYSTRIVSNIGGTITYADNIVISGTYSTTDASSSNPVFVGVSVGNESNTFDQWFPVPAATTSDVTNKAFSVRIPTSALPPGEKVYFVTRVVSKPKSSAGWGYFSATLTTRQQTFYTNRTPQTATIVSPSSGVSMVVDTGDSVTMQWDFDDDDKVGAANTPLLQDYGGYWVQVRPAPTVADPDPVWVTPTLHLWSNYEEPALNAETSPNLGLAYRDRRGWNFRLDRTHASMDPSVKKDRIKIIADADGDAAHTDATLKEMWLGPGTWQVRARTFDRSAANLYAIDGLPQVWYINPADAPAASSGGWSTPITLYVIGNSSSPLLGPPYGNEARYEDITFEWQFQTPVSGRTQRDWTIFIREVGTTTWTAIGSNSVTYDGASTFTFVNGTAGYTMLVGHQYEWTARTRDSGLYISEPAEPQQFWWVAPPESGPELPLPEITVPDPGLGCGRNRVFLYSRGGTIQLGEITEITQVVWTRVRDDISTCDVTINGWSQDCGKLLSGVRSWQHELVVFRDNGSGLKRVWEGPVVRVSYEVDKVAIEAYDVMGYVYRRILRQGYNDAYRKVNGIVRGLTTVTNRSRKIIQNALAYDDPNVLPYLWVLTRGDDAKQSRVVPDWSRTAWQEVDDLAAKAGLDYTTVGRRIMLWDTHNPIGVLPEMRDKDFDSPPVVTEYGMQMANVYGVTNNNGIYGYAERQPPNFYGYVEMLISAWGESDENGDEETLTEEAAAALKESLMEQADRGISQRWPTPLVVRVPDNSTLSPDLNVGINQLIPGVHIPVLSENTLRRVGQMQKLDTVRVTETERGETVQVTLSPAPTSRDYDPDDDMSGGDT